MYNKEWHSEKPTRNILIQRANCRTQTRNRFMDRRWLHSSKRIAEVPRRDYGSQVLLNFSANTSFDSFKSDLQSTLDHSNTISQKDSCNCRHSSEDAVGNGYSWKSDELECKESDLAATQIRKSTERQIKRSFLQRILEGKRDCNFFEGWR